MFSRKSLEINSILTVKTRFVACSGRSTLLYTCTRLRACERARAQAHPLLWEVKYIWEVMEVKEVITPFGR